MEVKIVWEAMHQDDGWFLARVFSGVNAVSVPPYKLFCEIHPSFRIYAFPVVLVRTHPKFLVHICQSCQPITALLTRGAGLQSRRLSRPTGEIMGGYCSCVLQLCRSNCSWRLFWASVALRRSVMGTLNS
jgi:hypothetical protein